MSDQVAQLFEVRHLHEHTTYINEAGLPRLAFSIHNDWENVLFHPTLIADRFLAEFPGHVGVLICRERTDVTGEGVIRRFEIVNKEYLYNLEVPRIIPDTVASPTLETWGCDRNPSHITSPT